MLLLRFESIHIGQKENITNVQYSCKVFHWPYLDSRCKYIPVDCTTADVNLVTTGCPSPHPPSPQDAVCQSPHFFSMEEFSPVIHPSCVRLHGQLKKNCLARPKRGDHMLQHNLPSALPSSPLGPHLWGFRGHGACGFLQNGAGRNTQRLQT